MCVRRITEQWNSFEEIGYIMNQAGYRCSRYRVDYWKDTLTVQYVNTKLILFQGIRGR